MVTSNSSEYNLDPDCPLRQLLGLIGDKWTPPVLYLLSLGVQRYSDFQRHIPGISKKMLTQTLRALEADGIVERTVYPVVPPKVEYRLTPFGETLIEPVAALATWAKNHRESLQKIYKRRY
ncbi:helix-turn-helix domain-containing protein [Nostoc sp. TCL26-01]|uniref:winged helix-turn-helix transcriptional regulator n=1 Tax=Nostoc sp. TCL26-01 TaxID=2576904 RepID=UPI0015BA86BD|nr:helix-turn-helix domain-containing protein [Nostoc sp. TCL26-01]QLE55607.1 helix-turn-helix transcriptional regulator [Nostoc sp. TCL26-01]